MSTMKHALRQWPSMLLFILFISQIVALFRTHSLIYRLTLCDTILLIIVHGYKWVHNNSPGLQLFLRLAGLVTFEALIFVNLTHAMEMLFCEWSHMHFSGESWKSKQLNSTFSVCRGNEYRWYFGQSLAHPNKTSGRLILKVLPTTIGPLFSIHHLPYCLIPKLPVQPRR